MNRKSQRDGAWLPKASLEAQSQIPYQIPLWSSSPLTGHLCELFHHNTNHWSKRKTKMFYIQILWCKHIKDIKVSVKDHWYKYQVT